MPKHVLHQNTSGVGHRPRNRSPPAKGECRFWLAGIGEDNSSAAGKPVGRTIATMLWPTAFVLTVGVFGFMPVIPVYVFLFVVVQGKKSFRQGIIAAAVTTAFTYVVFELLLSCEVYKGIVFSG